MSQRALKKKELSYLQRQEREQHQLFKQQQQEPNKYPTPKIKLPNQSDGNGNLNTNLSKIKHRFSSTPNLLNLSSSEIGPTASESALKIGPSTLNSSRSESDLSRIPEENNLVNAKSEFHLKSIASKRIRPDTIDANGNQNHSEQTKKSGKFNQNLPQRSRMSSRSAESSHMTCSITSIMSDTMQPRSPSAGFADTDNIRIPIIGYEVMEERARFTVYKLRVENPFTNDCWLVLRRYTDFQRLNNKLKSTFPQLSFILPRKKIFGDNFSSVFLTNRVQGLQMFINSVMANPQLRDAQIVRDFFCLDEPPAYSESMEECRAIFEAQEETISHLKVQLRAKDDLIIALQQQMNSEIEKNQTLASAIKITYDNCLNCSKSIDDFLSNGDGNGKTPLV